MKKKICLKRNLKIARIAMRDWHTYCISLQCHYWMNNKNHAMISSQKTMNRMALHDHTTNIILSFDYTAALLQGTIFLVCSSTISMHWGCHSFSLATLRFEYWWIYESVKPHPRYQKNCGPILFWNSEKIQFEHLKWINEISIRNHSDDITKRLQFLHNRLKWRTMNDIDIT